MFSVPPARVSIYFALSSLNDGVLSPADCFFRCFLLLLLSASSAFASLLLFLLLLSCFFFSAAAAACALSSVDPSASVFCCCCCWCCPVLACGAIYIHTLPAAGAGLCARLPSQAIRLIEGGESELDAGDKGGQTPIHIACYRVSQNVIQAGLLFGVIDL